mmetsp:Transcript_23332/g.48570  ORF Transcript_23332/g.48570 Transcript_23332/m.48570 type:complete len:499 (-) Transcript_23332:81-1577(-)
MDVLTLQGWDAAIGIGNEAQPQPCMEGSAEHFFRSLAVFLRSCGPGRPVLLSRVASCGPVQAAWSALQRASSRNLKMKQFILQRPDIFRMITDTSNQPHVLLAIHELPLAARPAGCLQLQNEGSAPGTGVLGPLASSSLGTGSGAMKAEQIAAIESHLRQVGGAEYLSRLSLVFSVNQAQLRKHFTIERCDGDPIVGLRVPGDLAGLDVHFSSDGKLTVSCTGMASSTTSGTLTPAGISTTSTVSALESLLARLVPSQHSVCDVMVFCFDNASYAAPLARRLTVSLGEKGLGTEAALSRLYAISDVVNNCIGKRPGASQFLASFENLLPEAFEQLGREWFRRIEDLEERGRAESRIRCVLFSWQRASVFPPLFTRGLEALLFAPVLEDAACMPDAGTDELLQAKLNRWFSVANQARLPYACRLRGLSGKALPTAACRARLCHFERYWHIPGVALPEDPDLFGEESSTAAAAPAAEADDVDSIDGEPLSEAELAELMPS